MLIEFKVTNFRSFKNETTLSFQETRCSEHPHHLIDCGKEKFLKTAVIYGANTSGKSNLYSAFEYMKRFVMYSYMYEDYINIKSEAFLFDEKSNKEPSTFEVYFTLNKSNDNIEYKYGFSINKGNITEEWLCKKAINARNYIIIFERSIDKFNLSGIPKEHRMNIKVATGKNNLIISIGSKLKIPICNTISKWFKDINCINFETKDMCVDPNDIKDTTNIVKYLNSFEPTVSDVTYDESKNTYNIIYKTDDSGNTYKIPLAKESAGMKKMFNLYSRFKFALNNGSVLFVDSLDANLHPLLLRDIVITFFDDKLNPNNAQLIFTTDDISNLDKSIFRRDEIWFVNKKNNISELYSLVDFKGEDNKKIRKDEDYCKNYLLGKYGAIPNLENIRLI